MLQRLASPATPYAVDCIGTCELDLAPLWDGTAGDVYEREFTLLVPPDKRGRFSSGSVGVVRLTLVAQQALAALRAWQQGA